MWHFTARQRGACSLGLALLLLQNSAASAEPTPTAPGVAPPAARGGVRRYRDSLERGRSLASQGELPAAAAALREALAVRPDDPVVLSELGLVAYRQRDLALAAELTRKALALARGNHWDCVSPLRSDGSCIAYAGKVRAASLFNLGLILEASDDRRGAIDAYARSLGEDCNRGVREHLIKLDGDPPTSCDHLATRPMNGPFARLSDWCARVKKGVLHAPKVDDSDFDMDSFLCTPERSLGALADLPAHVQAVRVFESTDHGTRGRAEISTSGYHLAFRMARGWFVCPFAAAITVTNTRGSESTANLSLETLALGAPIAETRTIRLVTKVVEDQSSFNYSLDRRDSWHYEQWVLTIAGVGPSGEPRCTSGLPFQFRAWAVDDTEASRPIPGSKRTAHLKLQIDPDGRGELAGPADLPVRDASVKVQYGRHRIRFP